MAKYSIEVGADLPSGGIVASNQFGQGPVDTGDVIAFYGEQNSWMIRLKPGEFGSLEWYALDEAYIVNNKGHVYWIDPSARSVQFVESRYASFTSTLGSGDCILAFDFQDICCIDGNGLRWRNDDLMHDDLAIERCSDGEVLVTGWKVSPNDALRLRLSLKDGELIK